MKTKSEGQRILKNSLRQCWVGYKAARGVIALGGSINPLSPIWILSLINSHLSDGCENVFGLYLRQPYKMKGGENRESSQSSHLQRLFSDYCFSWLWKRKTKFQAFIAREMRRKCAVIVYWKRGESHFIWMVWELSAKESDCLKKEKWG